MEAYKIPAETLKTVLEGDTQNNGAAFTVRSMKTHKDYTYKISKSEFNGQLYTHVRVETEYLNFSYLGSYRNGKIVRKGSTVETPSAVAISWILDKVQANKFELLNSNVELMHLGKCVRCGKTLTDATSIEIGLGPTCRHLKK